jgi:hypothetical protein
MAGLWYGRGRTRHVHWLLGPDEAPFSLSYPRNALNLIHILSVTIFASLQFECDFILLSKLYDNFNYLSLIIFDGI